MNSNRYYTVMIVPEKTSKVKKLVLPRWLLRGSAIGLAFLVLLAGAMIFDYAYVMSQIGENRQLKLENRRLRQQVQIFQNKVATVETTLDRVKNFATRLKVIMHVEDQTPNLQGKLPDANTNISTNPQPSETTVSSSPNTSAPVVIPPPDAPSQSSLDPENLLLEKEYSALETKMSTLNKDALLVEEVLQDEYEILHDKKAFLAALPTRQPASGYFTSGFGVRMSPYGDRVKMHEGLDIANRIGTLIRAPADGEVVYAEPKAGYGLTLILNHGYGIETWYGHLKHFLVARGTKVKRGAKIALLGNSGRSTGPHVHYEVRVKGYPVDPLSYIFEDSTP